MNFDSYMDYILVGLFVSLIMIFGMLYYAGLLKNLAQLAFFEIFQAMTNI